MPARHGWKPNPSPRRGFTFVEAARGLSASPVVVAVHDSVKGALLFRSALDEAIIRRLDLVVLDYGARSLRDELDDDSSHIDPRERNTLRTFLSNSHVRLVRAELGGFDLDRTVSYCESVEASLLVLGADHVTAEPGTTLSRRVFGGAFDLLIVTDHPVRDPVGRWDPEEA